MRGQRPPDQSDPMSKVDDRTEHVVVSLAVQSPLVQVVDLALDDLNHQEIANEHLVDKRRQQIASVEQSEPGVANKAFSEPLQRCDFPVMDGQHEARRGNQVELATEESGWVVIVGLQGLEREVKAILGPGEPRLADVLADPTKVGLGEAKGPGDLGESVIIVSTVKVDPEQLTLAEGTDGLVVQLDRAIQAARVEQTRGQPAQWISASRPAAATATKAVRYWSASIVRSAAGS